MAKPNEFLYNLEQGTLYHKTLDNLYASGQIGKTCMICEKTFPIYTPRDERMFCNECCKRLKKLLYPN